MVFLIESIVACALFTLFVFLMSRDPIKTVFNYPPAIIERCDKLGLVDASNKPGGVGFYVKKLTASCASAVSSTIAPSARRLIMTASCISAVVRGRGLSPIVGFSMVSPK